MIYLHRRRHRRLYLVSFILLILCVSVFFQSKYHLFHGRPQPTSLNMTASPHISLEKLPVNCSGNPLKRWCAEEETFCRSAMISYHGLFFITRSVTVQPQEARGKRLGGETIESVMNQAETDEYFEFNKGFLQLPCNDSTPSKAHFFDHLQQIASAITPCASCPSAQLIINETTIAVNRHDYVNFYHTITDVYTAYLLCRFFQRDPKSVRILFIDAHPQGSLDDLWSHLFHSYTRLGELKKFTTVFYRELIWAQPQSMSEIDIARHQRQPPSFFDDFHKHVLRQYELDPDNRPALNCQSVQVLFLGRRNYVAHPRNPAGRITRQLPNEQFVLKGLKSKFSQNPTVNFSSHYFEQLPLKSQLAAVFHSDIFAGMHGAGLTHVLFLKPQRTLVELASPSMHSQIHFQLMAAINNVRYHRCSISSDSADLTQTIFDCLNLQLSQLCPSGSVNASKH